MSNKGPPCGGPFTKGFAAGESGTWGSGGFSSGLFWPTTESRRGVKAARRHLSDVKHG